METGKQYARIVGFASAPARYNGARYDGMYSKTSREEGGRPVYQDLQGPDANMLWYDARAARWVITPARFVGGTKMPQEYVEVRSTALVAEEIGVDEAWAICPEPGRAPVNLFPRPQAPQPAA